MVARFFFPLFSFSPSTPVPLAVSKPSRPTQQVLTAGPLPSHVAFIMDGNRRFAESRLGTHDAAEGHAAGFAALLSALEWCLDLGVRTVSVFAFSVDNFSRPEAEVDALMELAREKLGELAGNSKKASEEGGTMASTTTAAAAAGTAAAGATKREEDGGALLQRHGVQLRVLGELSRLPPAVREAARAAEKATERGDRARLNVCLAYSSTRELADAVSTLSKGGPSLARPSSPSVLPAPASPTTPLEEEGASSGLLLAAPLLGRERRPSLTPSPARSPAPAETAATAAAIGSGSLPCFAASPSPPFPAGLIDKALYTAGCPPVDLLLRTSGEQRLSDFLLWQSRHAALVFAPRLWPELRFWDVARAVVAFQRAHPRLEGLRRAAAQGEETEAEKEEAAAAAATVSRADDAAVAAPADAPPAAVAAPAAPAAPPPPARGRGEGGGGGVPRRVRGSRNAAGVREQAFPSFSGGGGGGAATAAAGGEAPGANDGGEDEKGENGNEHKDDVLDWASRSTWRTRRRGDAEIEDEEGANGGGPEGEHGGFDPHCPCCLTTGGRLIDGAAHEPKNLKMPDGLEAAMQAKKLREAEVRAAMAAARAERERKVKEEEEAK